MVLERQGHQKKANDMYKRTLEMCRDVFGSNSEHPGIFRVMNNIQEIRTKKMQVTQPAGGSMLRQAPTRTSKTAGVGVGVVWYNKNAVSNKGGIGGLGTRMVQCDITRSCIGDSRSG